MNSGMITAWNGMNMPTIIKMKGRLAPRNGVLDSTKPLRAPRKQEMTVAGTAIWTEFQRLPFKDPQARLKPDMSIEDGRPSEPPAAPGPLSAVLTMTYTGKAK
jgi:hypothetical protein